MHRQEIDLSVVVPVYRSAACLPKLLEQLHVHLPDVADDFEIILVDDSSPDQSWDVIQREAAAYPRVKAVRLMHNAGQVQATLCGLTLARGRIIVTMDDDLQHPPDQVALLVDALRGDASLDCVFGAFGERRHASYRTFASLVLGWLHATSFVLPPGVRPSSFRALRHPLKETIVRNEMASPSLNVTILESTRRVGGVRVLHAARFAGHSTYTVARQLRQGFDNLFNSSTLPLRTMWLLGFTLCGLGFAAAIVVLDRSGTNTVPPDGAAAVWQLVVAGVALVALARLAEYSARFVRRGRLRNRFVISQLLEHSSADHRDANAAPRRP
jgi:hypothetical protein